MDLKEKVFSGLMWKFGERIIAQVVSTIVSIILARILMPDDYGIIAIVLIFINIADTFVSTGFGQALVQDDKASDEEFSTLFYCSILTSVVLYVILFFVSPVISNFYGNSSLTLILRVLGLRLVMSGANTIQQAYVQKKMIFKIFFYSTLIGTLLSAAVGIYGAYHGWGVWALVAQYMTNSVSDTIVLFCTTGWKPKRIFSKKKARRLIMYGWKLTAAELVNNCYNEFRTLLIGKISSSADLAYYSKGEQFPKLITANLNSTIISVLFPAISTVNKSIQLVKEYTRRAVQIGSYVIIPCMVGLAAVSDIIIPLLLTEKWNFVIPYMRIACICWAFVPINSSNVQSIKAIGRSDVYLKMETTKKVISIALMIAAAPFGVIWIALIKLPCLVVEIAINCVIGKKYINYKTIEYINDLKNPVILSILMWGIIYGFNKFVLVSQGNIMKLVVDVIIGGVVYIIGSILIKDQSFKYLLDFIKQKVKRG